MMNNNSRHEAIHTLAVCLMCALLLLPCFSCKKSNRYYNREKTFSIVPPEKWEIKEDYMGASVVILSPSDNKNDLFRENLNIVVEDIGAGIELPTYLKHNLKNMAQMLQDFRTGTTENFRLNRHEAGRVEYSFSLGILPLESTVTVLLSHRRAYVITCSSLKEDAPRFREIFRRTVDSFRIEEAGNK